MKGSVAVFELPLRCCKALSIHESQGVTVGPGKQFQCLTVHYPTGNTGTRSTLGLELVATSRVEDLSCLAICNKPASELSSKAGAHENWDHRGICNPEGIP